MDLITAPEAYNLAFEARQAKEKEKETKSILDELHKNFIELTLKEIADLIETNAKQGMVNCSYVLYDNDFFVCNETIKLSAGLIIRDIIHNLRQKGYRVDYFNSYPAWRNGWNIDELDYTLNIMWGAS